MSNATAKLKYKNEDDRCYGLAGMTITLAALDAIDRVVAISLDDDFMVDFINEYYFEGSPTVSAKTSWNHILENFHITSAMMISNLMSRRLIYEKKEIDREMIDLLYETIAEEGKLSCSLEEDEIRELFEKMLSYSRRIFANRRIYPMVDKFVKTINERRTLSGSEVREELHILQLL